MNYNSFFKQAVTNYLLPEYTEVAGKSKIISMKGEGNMPNGCLLSQTLQGWQIQLVVPADITQSANVFQYVITRVDPQASQQLSNIRICLCPGISDEERTNLLQSCSYTVTFDDPDSTTIVSQDCFIDNRFPNPNENPAACKGLKFNNIPSGDDPDLNLPPGTEQVSVTLNFTLTQLLPIGLVDIGFKAGDSGGIWTGICGPICEVVTRGVIL